MHKGYDDLQQLLPAFAKLLKHVTQTRSQTPGIMPCLKWPFDHQWFGFLRDAEGSESSLQSVSSGCASGVRRYDKKRSALSCARSRSDLVVVQTTTNQLREMGGNTAVPFLSHPCIDLFLTSPALRGG